jgi:hypothetical protein
MPAYKLAEYWIFASLLSLRVFPPKGIASRGEISMQRCNEPFSAKCRSMRRAPSLENFRAALFRLPAVHTCMQLLEQQRAMSTIIRNRAAMHTQSQARSTRASLYKD